MPIPLRADFEASQLRAAARRAKDGPQARRLLALAAVYDGASRTEAAKIGGVTLQIVRDWVIKFNARGPEGLIDGKAPGQPSRLNDTHRAALAAVIESGPIPAIHGVVRCPPPSLKAWSITSHSPLAVQRRNWRCTEFQRPSSSGRSRQGAPVRMIQKIASSTRRWSCGGRPRSGPPSITNGAKNAHSSSLINPRTTADLLHEDQLQITPRRVGGIPLMRFVHAS